LKSKWEKKDKKRKKENQSSSSDSSTCNDSTAVSSVLSEVNGVLYGSQLTDSTPVTAVIGNFQDGITSNQDHFDLPYLYWISKLHKNPYKRRYIAGSSKESLQRYCSTVYSRSGVNQMWILKNSKEHLQNLKYRDFSKIDSIKTYDFSTLYTILPHNKLKSRLFQIINNCLFKQKWHPEIQISCDWKTR
jgi:hypothetical protein